MGRFVALKVMGLIAGQIAPTPDRTRRRLQEQGGKEQFYRFQIPLR